MQQRTARTVPQLYITVLIGRDKLVTEEGTPPMILAKSSLRTYGSVCFSSTNSPTYNTSIIIIGGTIFLLNISSVCMSVCANISSLAQATVT